MRTPMPILEQIEVLRAYLRTLRADCERATREAGAHYRKRRVSPFVENLRYRRQTQAYELRDVAEECLRQLRAAQALSVADWQPGDVLTVETTVSGLPPNARRLVVADVVWSKLDGYYYDVCQITKAGQFYERGGEHFLFPSDRIRVSRCLDSLPEATQRLCAQFRRQAESFLEDVRDRGSLDDIAKWVRERRARSYL